MGAEPLSTKITVLSDFMETDPTRGMGWGGVGPGEGRAPYGLFSAGLEGTAITRYSGPGSILGFSCPSWFY